MSRRCAWCAARFEPKRKDAVCCSTKCRVARTARHWREANPERGAEAQRRWSERNPGYNRHYRVTNPERMAEAQRRWRDANPERVLEHSRRRKARVRGAKIDESFTSVEVFERDYWVCQICSEPVDRTLQYPDPLSASLDHVVPISLGGAHSRANTQCTHLVCNVRKGARLP